MRNDRHAGGGATSAAAGTVRSDADQLASDYQRLSTASTVVEQYQQSYASTAVNQRDARFAAEFRALDRMLGVV